VIDLLRTRHVASGREIAQALGISQATFSRAIKRAGEQVITLGRGPATRYALPRAIAGVPGEIPMFEVDEEGIAHRTGLVTPLHGGSVWAERRGEGILFDGMPFYLADMAPQGFLGRAFARSHPDLQLPERITDWNDDHILRALVHRGNDTVGNVIIGEEAVGRFIQSALNEISPIAFANQATEFERLAQEATEGQPAGSSAGGERPKFTAWVQTAEGPRQMIVKFSPPLSSEVGQRWSDLLTCEGIAAGVLLEAGIAAPRCEMVRTERRSYLMVERFDRIGARGRRGVVSLSAIHDYLHGQRDNYTNAASRLQRSGTIPPDDAAKMRLIHCFGMLIGNTDMHYGNVSFFLDADGRFRLTPIYDMLPMFYAPMSDQLVERKFAPATLATEAMSAWHQAYQLAGTFWRRVVEDPQISGGFKAITRANEQTIGELRAASLSAVNVPDR